MQRQISSVDELGDGLYCKQLWTQISLFLGAVWSEFKLLDSTVSKVAGLVVPIYSDSTAYSDFSHSQLIG